MSLKLRLRQRARQLGPGLITGAADDDPSGIATYSQAGAQFGFAMLWTVVFTLPLMAAIQIVSARIGYVTRRGLTANMKAAFPRPVVLAVVGMLLVANTLNIAADIAAMAEALRLLVGGSAHVYAVTFGLLCLMLQVFLPFHLYVRWLKWLTLALLAYVAVAFMLKLDWWQVMVQIVRPQFPAGVSGHDLLLMVVAALSVTSVIRLWGQLTPLNGDIATKAVPTVLPTATASDTPLYVFCHSMVTITTDEKRWIVGVHNADGNKTSLEESMRRLPNPQMPPSMPVEEIIGQYEIVTMNCFKSWKDIFEFTDQASLGGASRKL